MFESRQERRQNFLLQIQLCVLTLIWCPFHPRVTAVECKIPRSFCQKCRWQVKPKHAYTLDTSKSEWADYAAVQAECGNLSGNELTRNSSGNTLHHLTHIDLKFDIKSSEHFIKQKLDFNVCVLISFIYERKDSLRV